MQSVYTCSNTTEAHLIKGLLEQHSIPADVQGDYLQGAMGELPAIGIITIMVAEEYVKDALNIIDDYEQGQTEIDETTLTEMALTAEHTSMNNTTQKTAAGYRQLAYVIFEILIGVGLIYLLFMLIQNI